jgi:large subunit ribosomal protein L18
MKNQIKEKIKKRERRARRVKMKILQAGLKPRLSVFRSNKHIYVQLIDDLKNQTIVAARDQELSEKEIEKIIKEKKFSRKVAAAYLVGKLIAKKALEKKVEEIVFDRQGYKYHGRIKALAEGAREGGLKF